jgi:multidrug resistance efflux pump
MLAIAVVLALATAGFLAFRRPRAAPVPPPPALPAAPAEITLTGTIQDARIANVAAPLDGTIDQFLADVGQHVSDGEVLARIANPKLAASEQMAKADAEAAQDHLRQLELGLIAARLEVSRWEADALRIKVDLDQAEKAFERQRTMFREGVTPRVAYEQAEHEYNSLKAESENLAESTKKAADRVDSNTKELDPARKTLAQKISALEDAKAETAVGEVNSPVDGVVVARHGRPGQPVTPAISDLFQIAAAPQAFEVVAGIQPQTAPRIQPGQTVEIQLANGTSAGTVREVKSGQVFIDMKNPPPAITRGMTVQIKIK